LWKNHSENEIEIVIANYSRVFFNDLVALFNE